MYFRLKHIGLFISRQPHDKPEITLAKTSTLNDLILELPSDVIREIARKYTQRASRNACPGQGGRTIVRQGMKTCRKA